MEIPKLFDEEIEKDENNPIVQWMEFLDGKSKGAGDVSRKEQGYKESL